MGSSNPIEKESHLATSDDIRRLFRSLDDHAVAEVLALRPTLAQLEEAWARAAGDSETFADLRPAEGVVAAIMTITAPYLEDLEDDG